MKISEHFGLGIPSSQLDFLDVDLSIDNLLYLDPNRILSLSGYDDILQTLGTFWDETIKKINAGEDEQLSEIWKHLGEPNETRLGMSKGKPNGKGVGLEKALRILDRIKDSKAVQTGLVEDLQDISLFVHYVGADNISDMATNIIGKHLVEYTQSECKKLKIPMNLETNITYWESKSRNWVVQSYLLPEDEDGKAILFIPKTFISQAKWFKNDWLYNGLLLDSEIERHKSEKTNLVKTRKDGEKYVQKNDIKTLHKKTYKNRKEAVTGLIGDKYKDILHKYKQSIIYTFQEEFREYGYDPIISNKGM